MKGYVFILGLLGGVLGAVAFQWLNTHAAGAAWGGLKSEAAPSGLRTLPLSLNRPVENTEEKSSYESTGEKEDFRPVYGNYYPSLIEAAEKSKESVVFVRNLQEGSYDDHPFAWFFGATPDRVSSGSGVIFRANGYIVTNHHVIKEADHIEIVHKKRSYKAALVGSDPSTDIAVVKIEAEDLPNIVLGSSEALRIGEWVVAVGNPFNLTSTVTAGIVSAKGRDINLVRDKFPIESFIQTDAAINPGNSGGALVDAEGKLVGINTAILSRTGYYSGYSFAVPVDIVRKVVDDLIRYGEVQRAFTGMQLVDIDSKVAEEVGLSSLEGVLIGKIQSEGAAAAAGLKAGDVILEVNNKPMGSKSDLEGLIGHAYPGDRLRLRILRKGTSYEKELILLNREGHTDILRRISYYSQKWGIELESISKVEKDLYKTPHGVKIIRAQSDFFKGFPKNFIITHINRRAVKSPKELEHILKSIRGRVLFQGITQEGRRMSIQGNIY